jgi:phosphoglycerate dehydrogenase-like enzyme
VPERTLQLLSTRPQISVHNLHHNAAPTSEQALALLLAVAKRICPRDRALRRGDWSARYAEQRSLLLEGRTAVILGAGAIGRRLERMCQALGMPTECVGRAGLVEAGKGDLRQGLHAVLPRAQVLLLALPLTAETKNLLTSIELALLPEGSVLVNIARGPVIDQWALHDALATGHLAGAGLDVWWNYPEDEAARLSCPPSDAPLQELDQVVMSPHLAGHTGRTEHLRAEHLAALLREIDCGNGDESRVDVARGY